MFRSEYADVPLVDRPVHDRPAHDTTRCGAAITTAHPRTAHVVCRRDAGGRVPRREPRAGKRTGTRPGEGSATA